MDYSKKSNLSVIMMLLILSVQIVHAQSNFNSEEYYQFVENHQDMDSQELLDMYPLQTTYWSEMGSPAILENFEYLDSIQIKYELTGDELTALRDQHFIVSERLSFVSMGEAYVDIFRKDLPVFVSTDAILYALHRSYDEILKELEYSIMVPELSTLLDAMYAAYPGLLSKYSSNELMINALGDVDLFVTMAKSLMEGSTSAPQLITSADFETYWNAVQAMDFVGLPLFSESNRLLDFSQFTVRGHYADSETLSQYFKAMMWLGRMDFLLTQPPGGLPEEDLLRMNIGAVLMNELLNLSGKRGSLDKMDELIGFMVGEVDNLTTTALDEIITTEGLQSATDLLDPTTYTSFSSAVALSPYSDQKILSNTFIYGQSALPPALPVSYRLFGQRFVIDSYIFSQVVFPSIRYQNSNVWRPMPDPLDVMFALGNNDAAQLIKDELDTYNYSSSLAGVRYLVDAHDEEFWSQSLYNTWLNAIRTLNPPSDDSKLPAFMKTAGWHQQKLNTQLASWAQLKHDNLLYAKQPHTGGGRCYYPFGYVEPYPEFYQQIGNFAKLASNYFTMLNTVPELDLWGIIDYFEVLGSISDTLETLATKELAGTPFDERESNFLKRVLTSEWQPGGSGGSPADGWYVAIFFGNESEDASSKLAFEEDFLVSDVHTQPTDAVGTNVGNVLHAGVGNINLGVYLVEQPNDSCGSIAYVGAAMSYYEEITENFTRLTDKDWSDRANAGDLPSRPDWVNVYLMDSSGSPFSQGRELPSVKHTGINGSDISKPATINISQNYPNPFNPITTISYALPEQATVSLKVYDIRGQEVISLQETEMPPGAYEVQWSGLDQSGYTVSTGVYFARLHAGTYSKTIKMVYLK